MNPSPAVQIAGLGAISADNCNTFLQVIANFAQLRTFTGLNDMAVYVLGGASEGDGLQGNFWFNTTSTATDNGSSVIVPNGAIQGAWLRLPVTVASITSVRYTGNVSSDTAQASDSLIVWNSNVAVPKTEFLPAPTTQGQKFTIKDAVGNSATYPITLSPAAGAVIGSNVINVAFNSLTVEADGVSSWLVV